MLDKLSKTENTDSIHTDKTYMEQKKILRIIKRLKITRMKVLIWAAVQLIDKKTFVPHTTPQKLI